MGVPGAGGMQGSVRLEDKMGLGHGSFGNQTGDFDFYSVCGHYRQTLLFVDSAVISPFFPFANRAITIIEFVSYRPSVFIKQFCKYWT